jgi:hypothetical protein
MFSRDLTPKQEDKNSKPKIITIKDISKKNTISLEYIFLNFH